VAAFWLTLGARWESPPYTKGLQGLALVSGQALCGSKFVAASWLTFGVCPESPICACIEHGFTRWGNFKPTLRCLLAGSACLTSKST